MTVEEYNEKITRTYDNILCVYEILKDYFGEDRVDLQGLPPWQDEESMKSQVKMYGTEDLAASIIANQSNPFFLVYWPTVTVTNEYDKSVVIKDLYAKIPMDANGRWEKRKIFALNRATYTDKEYVSFLGGGYMHSHVPKIPKHNFTDFQTPCLGTGPISNTISSLRERFDKSLWLLFCIELNTYVQVESLEGVPYHRLEEIGMLGEPLRYFAYTRTKIMESYNNPWEGAEECNTRNFIKHYITFGHLKFNYVNGCYGLGMNYVDFMVDISNSFIDYVNKYGTEKLVQRLFEKGLIKKVVVANGGICPLSSSDNDINNVEGSFVCMFKGHPITLHIEKNEKDDCHYTTIISESLSAWFLYLILLSVNYNYKDNHQHENNK